MYRAIVADQQELFRAGLFAVLAGTGEYSVLAGYSDWPGLLAGMKSWLPALVIASVNLVHDMDMLMARARVSGSRILLVAEDFDSLNCYHSSGAAGIVRRSASVSVLVGVARKIREGRDFVLPAEGTPQLKLGSRLAGRFTPDELTILALLMQGLKNRRIAERLEVADHVVAGHLQTIFDKTGFSTRLELALFLSSRVKLGERMSPYAG
jgi:DNA-binding NarL/FixJ family response regulator